MPVFIPRFLLAIAYLVALTVVGTVGYMAIDGWLWREALYHDSDYSDRRGFPGSPCTFRAWPGLYDDSPGGRRHGNRRLVHIDHFIHRGIQPD